MTGVYMMGAPFGGVVGNFLGGFFSDTVGWRASAAPRLRVALLPDDPHGSPSYSSACVKPWLLTARASRVTGLV